MPMNILRLTSLAVSLTLLGVGCIPGDEFLPVPDVWVCATDVDCGEPGYRCDTNTNLCVFGPPPPAACTDADGDGFGVGADRGECRQAEEDIDDTDADIFPGAVDVCDGKDNDGDMTTDPPIPCSSISDCPEDRPDDTLFFCEGSVCALKPSRQPAGVAECQQTLDCVSGAYAAVPAACL